MTDKTSDVAATAVPQGMRLSTAKLIEALKGGRAGDVLTDEQLSQHCGRPTAVGGSGYGNLQSAIRHVLTNYGICWQRVVGSGCIKCIDSGEKAQRLGRKLKHIHRTARREMKVAQTIDMHAIANDEKPEVLATIAALGVMHQFAGKRSIKALAARKATSAPDLQRMLAAFDTPPSDT